MFGEITMHHVVIPLIMVVILYSWICFIKFTVFSLLEALPRIEALGLLLAVLDLSTPIEALLLIRSPTQLEDLPQY
jgi:hypothetical protein